MRIMCARADETRLKVVALGIVVHRLGLYKYHVSNLLGLSRFE